MGRDDIHQMPGHLIRRAHQTMSALFAETVDGQDLTSVQFAALVMIAETPGIDATTVSALVALDRATIGGVIDRLEAKALIRREASETDRRVKRLHPTERGLQAVARVSPSVRQAQQRFLAALNEPDRMTFLRLLGRLVAAHDVRADRQARTEEGVV